MLDALLTAWAAQSSLEIVAVFLGIAYITLATRESPWCWVAGFGSTAIYVWLFWNAQLVMESALQVFYLVVSVYGFVRWQRGEDDRADQPIVRWSLQQHAVALTLIAVMTLGSGWLLSGRTQAALPYLDSFTTWSSVVATVMVAYKVLGNWVYWLVINIAGIYLYLSRGLALTTFLYAIYWVLAVVGLITWTRRYRAQG